MPKQTYILENLGCANCAAKIERKITALPEVEEAVIVFPTKKLILSAQDPDALLPEIRKIATSYEPDIRVLTGHSHSEGSRHDSCSCGHDHHEHAHHDTCGCGHDHHKHTHHDTCGCDHNHHKHAHHDTSGCGHDHHEHGSAILPAADAVIGDPQTLVLTVENLGCASCGAKMEARIAALPEVSEAVLTFATRQLRITAANPVALVPKLERICQSVEAPVRLVLPEKQTVKKAETVQKKKWSKETRQLVEILLGALLFIAGEILDHLAFDHAVVIPVCLLAYILLGWRIVLTAVKNLLHGQIFDENFLMSLATLAAIAIQDYHEAVGVMLFYRIGEFFEDRAVERSRTQIMDAVDLRPEVVTLVSGETMDAQKARVGDVLLVRPGDRIPLDGTVVEGESRLDTSPVTGEPVPVLVHSGDTVVSGCVNTSGVLKIRVEKVLEESMVSRILNSVENAAASKPKIDRFITRFARIYTPVVVGLALITAIVPSLFTGNWHYWIYTAITFLVISCPCALVLSVPLAFFSGIGAASKKGILLKGGVSIEAMNQLKAVVMDKTGTLTEGNFIVQEILPAEGVSDDQLLNLAAACESHSTHPVGNSILSAARQKGLTPAGPDSVRETAGLGIEARLPEGTALCGNRKLLQQAQISLGSLPENSYGTEVLVALNGRYMGLIRIADTIKEEAASAIASLKKAGLHTAMLTGDTRASAQAVASETDIDAVYAHLLPEEKLTTLRRIREKTGPVMFVGDGINDAPVLAGADVGAAMGSGADAAIEASDVVFMTDRVTAIPTALKLARKTAHIAWQNVVFALIIKVIILGLGLAGFASMWMAVFADTGVAILCVLNAIRILYQKNV